MPEYRTNVLFCQNQVNIKVIRKIIIQINHQCHISCRVVTGQYEYSVKGLFAQSIAKWKTAIQSTDSESSLN